MKEMSPLSKYQLRWETNSNWPQTRYGMISMDSFSNSNPVSFSVKGRVVIHGQYSLCSNPLAQNATCISMSSHVPIKMYDMGTALKHARAGKPGGSHALDYLKQTVMQEM